MDYIFEIVELIEDKEIEEVRTGLDDLLINKDGRWIANYLLVNHSKVRISIPSIWRKFKPAVVRYIKQNEHFTDKDIKKIAGELGISVRTLKSALAEDDND